MLERLTNYVVNILVKPVLTETWMFKLMTDWLNGTDLVIVVASTVLFCLFSTGKNLIVAVQVWLWPSLPLCLPPSISLTNKHRHLSSPHHPHRTSRKCSMFPRHYFEHISSYFILDRAHNPQKNKPSVINVTKSWLQIKDNKRQNVLNRFLLCLLVF